MKEAVLPFDRFPDVDTVLGPEMRSTGEVMGIDLTVGLAFAKSQIAAGDRLPGVGHGVPVAGRPGQGDRASWRPSCSASWASPSRPRPAPPATSRSDGIEVATVVAKLGEDDGGLDAVDLIESARSTWWSTAPGAGAPGPTAPTSGGPRPRPTSRCVTTAAAGLAAARGMADWSRHELRVRTLQEYHRGVHADQLSLPL